MAKRKTAAQRRAEEAKVRQAMIQRTAERFEEMQAQLEDLGRLIDRYNSERRNN
jgi:hypothetical protein